MNNTSMQAPSPVDRSMERQPDLAQGLLGGIIAMVICAAIWGYVMYPWQVHMSWGAILLGLAVGLGGRWLGKGNSLQLGLIAASLTVVGLLLGHLIAYSIYLARMFDLSISEMIWRLTDMPDYVIGHAVAQFKARFVVLDLLFYAAAIYLGFQIACGRIARDVNRPA